MLYCIFYLFDLILYLCYYRVMLHEMKLHNQPFQRIKQGIKKIEMRLFDEKRRQIKKGDTIVFTNRLNNDTLEAKVTNLYKFDSFQTLYQNFLKLDIGYLENEEANFKDMEEYYSEKEQKEYGVVAIEIKVIN